MVQVLKQCGDDLSRENIMKQAANIKNLEIPMLLPGIKINTGPTNFHRSRQMQLARWDGKTWERFGRRYQRLTPASHLTARGSQRSRAVLRSGRQNCLDEPVGVWVRVAAKPA